jgi:hypothetical protein
MFMGRDRNSDCWNGARAASLYVPLETRGYLPLFRSRTKITPP